MDLCKLVSHHSQYYHCEKCRTKPTTGVLCVCGLNKCTAVPLTKSYRSEMLLVGWMLDRKIWLALRRAVRFSPCCACYGGLFSFIGEWVSYYPDSIAERTMMMEDFNSFKCTQCINNRFIYSYIYSCNYLFIHLFIKTFLIYLLVYWTIYSNGAKYLIRKMIFRAIALEAQFASSFSPSLHVLLLPLLHVAIYCCVDRQSAKRNIYELASGRDLPIGRNML